MKPTKLILTFSFVWCLVLWCSGALVLCAYAADLDVESGGKLKSDTFTFNEQNFGIDDAAPAGSEGRISYSQPDSELAVSSPDGVGTLRWQDIEEAKTIATRIVGRDDGDGIFEAGESLLTGKTADRLCDGTADNVEIQQAIDSLGSNGGVVYLLEGTYNISSPIVFNNTVLDSNKALIGAGAGTLLQTFDNGVITASNVSGILISQLKIKGSAVGSEAGISFSGVTASKIDKIWIENMGGSAIAFASASNNNTISGNHLYNNVTGGSGGNINLASSNNNIISCNNIHGGRNSGIVVYGSSNNTISNNNIQDNDDGIYVYFNSQFNTISGNNIQDNISSEDAHGINLASGNNIVSNNNIQGSGNDGIYLNSSNNAISGNNIQGNDDYGIRLFASNNNNVSGNIIYDNGRSLDYDGIKINTNSDTNIFSSNRIYDSSGTGYGIKIYASTCDNNYLTANYIDGAGFAAKISDSGAGTQYTGKDKITLEPVSSAPADGGKIDLSSAGTGPTSYVQLNPGGNISLGSPAIDDGKASGDVLILENTSTNQVTINDNTNVQLYNNSPRTLGVNDTLKLIWNGTTDWIEVSFANN